VVIAETLTGLEVSIASIRPYGRNPRRGDVAAIRRSLEVNGQYRPIVVNRRTSEVLAGNHTLAAAVELGWSMIAATFVDVDDEEAARIVLADNRTADLAGYDDAELAELLISLEQDYVGTGWAANDFAALLASLERGRDLRDTDAGPLPAEPTSKAGDLWHLGPHRLLCGDATDTDQVARLMGGELASMVFTDPPYGVAYDGGTKVRERLAGDHSTGLYGPACEMGFLFSSRDAPLYLWHAGVKGIAAAAAAAAAAAGYQIRCEIVWNKNQAQYGALSAQYKQKHEPCYYCFKRGRTVNWCGPTNEVTVWDIDRAAVNDLHPTQKPIELSVRALLNHDAPTVLDLFAGSGSTVIAAEEAGRVCYALEIDPGYCDVIVDRWERHTGGKAERADL
jgi:DNA modification methylase